MREVIVKNEFDKSYLLIEDSNIEKNYIFQMIVRNKIPGLLECRTRYIEDNSYCSYDVSSKRSLEQEYADKKMNFQNLMELFYGLNEIINRANEYLLNHSHFIMEPKFLFKDMETEELHCLYFPDVKAETEKREMYRPLADFLLDKIDHRDEYAVNVAYHFYKISKEEYFSFDTFVGFIEKEALLAQAKEKREKEKCVQIKETQTSVSEIGEQAVRGFSYIEENIGGQENSPKWWISGVLFIVGALMTVGYFLIPVLHSYALYILLPGLTGSILGIGLLIRNIIILFREKEEDTYIQETEPVRVEEYFDDTLDDVTVFFDQEQYIRLKWKEGRFSKEYLLEEFPVTVGKLKESVQIVINDFSVSRLHARIRKQGNILYLQDLDSTNGTYVNQKRLQTGEEAIINRGDEIQFGKIIVNVV